MMRAWGGSMRRVVVLLFAAGCGYPAEKFQDDYVASYCAWAGDCHWYESSDVCADAYADWAPADEGCYDAKAAKDCIDALEALQCPAAEAAVDFPDACNAVYLCAE